MARTTSHIAVGPDGKIPCPCCDKRVTPTTFHNHRLGKGGTTINALALYQSERSAAIRRPKRRSVHPNRSSGSSSSSHLPRTSPKSGPRSPSPRQQEDGFGDDLHQPSTSSPIQNGQPIDIDVSLASLHIDNVTIQDPGAMPSRIQGLVSAGLDDDLLSKSDSDGNGTSRGEGGGGTPTPNEATGGENGGAEEDGGANDDDSPSGVGDDVRGVVDEDIIFPGVPHRDNHEGLLPSEVLNEEWQVDAMRRRRAHGISPDDLDTIRAYSLFITEHLTRRTWNRIGRGLIFRRVQLPSLPNAVALIRQYTNVTPIPYNMCRNTCCLFYGPLGDLEVCKKCKEPRYELSTTGRRRPTKVWYYIPLTPRLQRLFESPELAKALRYPADEHDADANARERKMTDIFDGRHIRSLRGRPITVLGAEGFHHRYFEDKRELVIGLATDGVSPFRRRKQTMWPIIIIVYSLGPDNRIHQEFIFSLGVIPGPKAPFDFNSFLEVFADELIKLAGGVPALDALTEELFALRAHLVTSLGDLPAIAKVSLFLGHNAKCPCKYCKIPGVRDPSKPNVTAHYVPLDRRNFPDEVSYDPLNLPTRSEDELRDQAAQVLAAPNDTRAKKLASEFGIKGLSCLARFGSISLTQSFPVEFMHLVWENLMVNLTDLWTGDFKDFGRADREISEENWASIGELTAQSGRSIPSQFGPSLPNIAESRTEFTADCWSLWTMCVAPVVLRGRFKRAECYMHFMELVRLINLCLQWEITYDDINEIRRSFARWVQQYEALYYRYSTGRVSACPVTVHLLLHIADSIEAMGPVWAYWSYPMERWCRYATRGIHSHRYPWASVANYVTAAARLYMIKVTHGLGDALIDSTETVLRSGETEYDGYPKIVMMPGNPTVLVSSPERSQISAHLVTNYNITRTQALDLVPTGTELERWAKMRRTEGGDTIHTHERATRAVDGRDTSFVKYCLLVDRNAHVRSRESRFYEKTFYGQLLDIIVLPLPRAFQEEHHTAPELLLARICECALEKRSDVDGFPKFKHMRSAPQIVDLNVVKAAVALVKLANGHSYVYDRTDGVLSNPNVIGAGGEDGGEDED